MNPRRSFSLLLLLASLLLVRAPLSANPSSAQEVSSSSSQSSSGLRVVTLATKMGNVKITVPDEIRAGDTISGTVTTEPKGKDPTERKDNDERLMRGTIKIDTQRWQVSDGRIQLTIPESATGPEITLTDEQGKRLAQAVLALMRLAELLANSQNPSLPQLGQTGRPYSIGGAFDGNSANTNVIIGGTPVKVLAESPRQVIVESPLEIVGPTNIEVKENGTTTTGSFRNLKIDLTAPKTSLMRGESTELHVQVQGLQGITQPVQVQLQNQSPSNVNITGGNTQNIIIQPAQVPSSGTFDWSTNVTGIGSGGFVITGSLPGTTTSPTTSPMTSPPTPTPTPTYSAPVSTPEVSPANELYSSFASEDTDCCKKLINNGVLTFQDDKGNSVTLDHDKLKMVIDGKTYEWQFTQDGKPLWIEWMFCHLKDNQIVSQGTQVTAQQIQGGKTNESGGSTNISLAGPYPGETTTRTSYGLQFTGMKIGTNNKEYSISFTLDEETCKWSFQLFADDKTVSASNGPPGSTVQLYNYILNNSALHTANAATQPAWWNNMYRLGGEIQTWNAWLATHPDEDQTNSLNAAYQLWSKMVQAAIDDLDKSANDQDKQLFNQMRSLLANQNPNPEQMLQIFLKFNDLWKRFGTGTPPK